MFDTFVSGEVRKQVAAFFATLASLLVMAGFSQDAPMIDFLLSDRFHAQAGLAVTIAAGVARLVWAVSNDPPAGGAAETKVPPMQLTDPVRDGSSSGSPPPQHPTTASSPWWIAGLAALALLAACATPQTAAQRFYGVAASYVALKEEAAAYAVSGPLCSEVDAPGCVPDDVVIAIDDVTDTFDPRVEAATRLFEDQGATDDDRRAAIAIARAAVRELAVALNPEGE